MNYKLDVTRQAKRDLRDYAAYIRASSPENAKRWLSLAGQRIQSLSYMPHRCTVIEESEEMGEELRDILHFSHRIIFRIDEAAKRVIVLRVWHSARRLTSEFDLE